MVLFVPLPVSTLFIDEEVYLGHHAQQRFNKVVSKKLEK